MSKIWIELPHKSDSEELQQFFKKNNVTHRKHEHTETCVKVEDALRAKSGIVARIMEVNSKEDKSFILISNKGKTNAELVEAFQSIISK